MTLRATSATRPGTNATVTTGDWSILADQVLGTGGEIQISDHGADGLLTRIYRASVEP